jgi:hypothetical protein
VDYLNAFLFWVGASGLSPPFLKPWGSLLSQFSLLFLHLISGGSSSKAMLTVMHAVTRTETLLFNHRCRS